MTPPEAILVPVEGAGEEVRGTLKTAASRAFLTPEGLEVTAPLWAIATDRRLWLLAHSDRGLWVAASGDPQRLRVEPGWVRDTLVVGPWRIPLRRRTRAAAEALVDAVRAGGGGGDPLPPSPTPPPPERAPAARGAAPIPDWLISGVPADPSERWLHALRTSAQQPFNLDDGSIARSAVWLASTDRRTVLAAQHPGRPTYSRILSDPVEHRARTGRTGRDQLRAGARLLPAPRGSGQQAELAAELSRLPQPELRWGRIARAALEQGRARDALRLIAEAHQQGHGAGWAVLARILSALQQPILAVGAAQEALAQGHDAFAAVDRAVPGDARRLARDRVDVGFVRGLLRDQLAALGEPEPPRGLPWPPDTPGEVWATALARDGRWPEALTLWEDEPEGPRQQAATAALAEGQRSPDADAAWERAARSLRATSPADAVEALQRALRLQPTPQRLWLMAAWAFEDGDPPEAQRHWIAALTVDPRGEAAVALPATAERALAAVAAGDEAWPAAVDALRRAIQADPEPIEPYLELAQHLAVHLSCPDQAAEALASLQRQHPTAIEPAWRLSEARHRLDAGDREGAAAVLRLAVAEDFLHPEVFQRAIALAPEAGLDPSWWRHVLWVLQGDTAPTAPGRTAIQALSRPQLDALHPGGIGVMERLRQAVTSVEPPDRRALVRGLGRLKIAEHGPLMEQIDALCVQLGIDPPATYLFRGEGAFGCSAWATDPPVLLIGAEHLGDGPRALGLDGLSFLVAVELVHLAAEHPVLTFDTDLVGTSRSMYQSFGRFAGTAEGIVDVVTLIPGIDQLAKLQTLITLSRRVFATRSTLDRVSDVATPVLDWLGIQTEATSGSVGRQGLEGAALAFRMQADRAALLLTGDLRAAVDAILRSSVDALDSAQQARAAGLAAVLSLQPPPPHALRLASLVAFAATTAADPTEEATRPPPSPSSSSP